MSWRIVLGAAPLALLVLATPAKADPCEGRLPGRPGVEFSGTVRYIGDGDSLCVGQTANPEEWIEVRIADFDAPELHRLGGEAAKAALSRLALSQPVVCTTERGRSGRVISFDRVIAVCRIGSTSIGDLLRRAGVDEGGN